MSTILISVINNQKLSEQSVGERIAATKKTRMDFVSTQLASILESDKSTLFSKLSKFLKKEEPKVATYIFNCTIDSKDGFKDFLAQIVLKISKLCLNPSFVSKYLNIKVSNYYKFVRDTIMELRSTRNVISIIDLNSLILMKLRFNDEGQHFNSVFLKFTEDEVKFLSSTGEVLSIRVCFLIINYCYLLY